MRMIEKKNSEIQSKSEPSSWLDCERNTGGWGSEGGGGVTLTSVPFHTENHAPQRKGQPKPIENVKIQK